MPLAEGQFGKTVFFAFALGFDGECVTASAKPFREDRAGDVGLFAGAEDEARVDDGKIFGEQNRERIGRLLSEKGVMTGIEIGALCDFAITAGRSDVALVNGEAQGLFAGAGEVGGDLSGARDVKAAAVISGQPKRGGLGAFEIVMESARQICGKSGGDQQATQQKSVQHGEGRVGRCVRIEQTFVISNPTNARVNP